MSTISPETHVAALVLADPTRSRVFERFEIDYCCGGNTPLETACAERGLDVGTVVAALEELREPDVEDVDWSQATISELCAHIVEQHHAYLRGELAPLRALVAKVERAHGVDHTELAEVRVTFDELSEELADHMQTEELTVFPVLVELERGDRVAGGTGPLEQPIAQLLHDHDEVASLLGRLRSLTGGYAVPDDACSSYRSMLERLADLEADTHRHVHEENNILFPRAVELEAV